MSRQLYRYHATVRLGPGNAPSGNWTDQEILVQIPARSIIEATQAAVAIGKQLGLLLIGPE